MSETLWPDGAYVRWWRDPNAGMGAKDKKVCKYFANGGTCFYGHECRYLHVRPQAEAESGDKEHDEETSGAHADGVDRDSTDMKTVA